jgi:hypothetical protein
MAWEYYGVRTFYRTVATGKPKKVDKYYDKDGAMLEERVVLIRARNFDEALKKGETEAKTYVEPMDYKNVYGQKVKRELLEAVDVFALFDNPPKIGSEVFSSTQRINSKQKISDLLNEKLGPEEKCFEWREKFTPWEP